MKQQSKINLFFKQNIYFDSSQENNQKRKSDQKSISNKKLCQSPTLITKQQSQSNEQIQTEIISKSISSMLYVSKKKKQTFYFSSKYS